MDFAVIALTLHFGKQVSVLKAGRILHIVIAVLFTLFLGGHFLMNDRRIQENAAGHLVSIAQSALGTGASAERVQFVYPFGISVDGLTLYDRSQDTLAHMASATLRFKPLQLLRHKMSITSIRLQNPDIRLSADSAGAEPNWAFLTELSGGDSTKAMSFRANSIIIRNGSVKYNLKSAPVTDSVFNTGHIGISGLNANLSLKSMDRDSLAFIIRKLEFAEQSGFRLSDARGGVAIGHGMSKADGLFMQTPSSRISIIGLTANRGLGKSDVPLELDAEIAAAVTGRDFMAFCPRLECMTDQIVLNLTAGMDGSRIGLTRLAVGATDNSSVLAADGVLHISDPIGESDIETLNFSGKTDAGLPSWIESQFACFNLTLPDRLHELGEGTFSGRLAGNLKDATADISANYDCGSVVAHAGIRDDRYTASIQGKDVRLDRLTGNSSLGPGSLKLEATARRNGSGFSGEFRTVSPSAVTYNGYVYRNIGINGSFTPSSAAAEISFNDRNGSILANAGLSKHPDGPDITLALRADSVNLQEYRFSQTDGMTLSAIVNASLHGTDPDLMTGRITVDSLYYSDSEGSWFMNSMTVSKGDVEDSNQMISVYGDFISLSMIGDYRLSTLRSSVLAAVSDVVPTVSDILLSKMGLRTIPASQPNTFLLDMRLDNTEFMGPVFHTPLQLERPATASCYINDSGHAMSAELTVPAAAAPAGRIEGAHLRLESRDGSCFTNIRGLIAGQEGGRSDLNATFTAARDSIDGRISCSDIADGMFEGTLVTHSRLLGYDRRNGWLKSSSTVDTTAIFLIDAPWDLSRTTVATDSGKIGISGFSLKNGMQYFMADGTVSADSSDILNLSLQQIDLDHTLTMLHANKARFRGTASGSISIAGVLDNPAFYGTLQADDFGFMDSYHGHLLADCSWNRALQRVDISARTDDNGLSGTGITGYYDPKAAYVDFDIDAEHTDLYFLNRWTKSTFREMGGRTTGSLRLFGGLKTLDLEGTACLEDGYFIQDAISSTFIIKHDTLRFEPGRMVFRDIGFYDENDHDGIMTCILNHDNFRNWRVNFNADFADMQVYRLPRTEQGSIYATLQAEGSMTLRYDDRSGLAIQADVRTSPGTRLGYSSASTVQDNSFLTIVDRNAPRQEEAADGSAGKNGKARRSTPLNLDFNVQCTDDAVIDVDISSLSGMFRGSGDISAKYNATDGLTLNGLYNVNYGQCALSVQDIIRKNFSLLENSYVRFNGSPQNTEMSIHTYHNVNSVSVYDLDPSLASNSSNVRVRCLMDITGSIQEPSLSFDVDMPSGTAQEKDILASATSTEEQRNLQFMYLLAIGRFYTYDYAQAGMNSMGPSAMESIVNSTVSGQINNLLAQVLDNEHITLSSNVSASSYLSNDATNLNNKELEGILEARLLDNRLLFNGNFGYRENTINNTSNFIGDFEIKYKLLPRQGISLKGYNKTNDKYFSKTTLTTQGVGVVFERDF